MPIVRSPLASTLNTRSSTLGKDEQLTNCYAEVRNGAIFSVNRRFGFTTTKTFSAASGLGLFSFSDQPVSVVGTVARLNSGALGTVDGNSQYQFTTTGANTGFFLKNNNAAYYYDGASMTQVTDVDYPPVTVPGVVNIDGFTCVLTTIGRLYNSDINAPTSFNALNFISTQGSDAGVACAKYMSYVLAFGQNSITFFYNANNATGSPFLPNKSATLNVGCANGNSVIQTHNTVFWIGKTKEKGRSVYVLDGLNADIISDVHIDRILSDDPLTNIHSYYIELNGHGFYILTLVASNVTLVYDTQTKMWATWTSASLGMTLNVTNAYSQDGFIYLTIPNHGFSNGQIGYLNRATGDLGYVLVNVLDANTVYYPTSSITALDTQVIDGDTIGNSLPANVIPPSGGGGANTPANSTVPTISGTPQVGYTLTATNGTWTNFPTSYTYQWNQNATPIIGATNSTYIPVTGDVASTLSVSVTANNSFGPSLPATSANTAAVVASTSGNVPGAPGQPAVTPSGSSLAVTWTAPTYAGTSPITGYSLIIQVDFAGGSSINVVALGPVLTYTYSPTSSGNRYTFSVYANNAAGGGNTSPNSVPYTAP